MARRRRPQREVAFSFDSFLDVVANVVGIILRLILVAWMGARSYKAVVDSPVLPAVPPADATLVDASLPPVTDERIPKLARRKKEIGAQEKALVGAMARRDQVRSVVSQLRLDLKALAARCQTMQEKVSQVKKETLSKAKATRAVALTSEELARRAARLQQDMEKLKKLPPRRTELRYLSPVSEALTHEVMFECRAGRVTLIDYASLSELYKRDVKAEAEALRTRWVVSPVTPPVGAFRLRYTLERERSILDGPSASAPAEGQFRFLRTYAEVEAITPDRGEPAEKMLEEGSEFRKVIDGLEAKQIAVTLWVYPDSFPLYRQLRDYLHKRDLVVAGRPVFEGMPIAFGIKGTRSRGQ